MPGSNEWEANYKAGRDKVNYSPYSTPDGVTDAGAYHAGGQSATSWASAFARQKASAVPTWPSSGSPAWSPSAPAGGEGGLLLLVLSVPPLVPPAILLYRTWVYLTGQSWDIWYKVIALGGEIALIGAFLSLFYRFTPKILAALLTAIYMTATYTGAASYFEFGEFWTGIIIVVAGTIGFFVGDGLSNNNGFGYRVEFAIQMLLMAIGAVIVVCGETWAISHGEPYWVVHQIGWWGGTGVAIGICTFVIWYPGKALFLAAAATGAFIWISHPDLIRSLLLH